MKLCTLNAKISYRGNEKAVRKEQTNLRDTIRITDNND